MTPSDGFCQYDSEIPKRVKPPASYVRGRSLKITRHSIKDSWEKLVLMQFNRNDLTQELANYASARHEVDFQVECGIL